jgi:PIN domain
MRVLDATTLTLLLNPDAPLPDDPTTCKPPERARERLDFLIETLDAEGVKLLIPTPALSEVLVKAGSGGPAFLDELTSSSVFKIEDFDRRAAVEAAAINISLEKAKTKAMSGSKVKTKFDVQIVAIAKVSGADIIYSEDTDIVKLGTEVGIKVVRVADLPMPPPKQQQLFKEGEKPSPEEGSEPPKQTSD